MEQRSEPTNTIWPFPFTPQDWEQTPPAVQAYLHSVCDALGQIEARVEILEARLTQNSTTSHQSPSSDSPYKRPRQCPTITSGKPAGNRANRAIARCSCRPRLCVR